MGLRELTASTHVAGGRVSRSTPPGSDGLEPRLRSPAANTSIPPTAAARFTFSGTLSKGPAGGHHCLRGVPVPPHHSRRRASLTKATSPTGSCPALRSQPRSSGEGERWPLRPGRGWQCQAHLCQLGPAPPSREAPHQAGRAGGVDQRTLGRRRGQSRVPPCGGAGGRGFRPPRLDTHPTSASSITEPLVPRSVPSPHLRHEKGELNALIEQEVGPDTSQPSRPQPRTTTHGCHAVHAPSALPLGILCTQPPPSPVPRHCPTLLPTGSTATTGHLQTLTCQPGTRRHGQPHLHPHSPRPQAPGQCLGPSPHCSSLHLHTATEGGRRGLGVRPAAESTSGRGGPSARACSTGVGGRTGRAGTRQT
ncbi:trithorax group protein osa-like [Lepus europaeus]|uniref:trithorax group protein osa-like n=1 Tax=Lepus europaeus TaxID=9983 RepID=UPI002B47A03E|nr:trithorax group protein osa-like [Lepus europaeus]